MWALAAARRVACCICQVFLMHGDVEPDLLLDGPMAAASGAKAFR